MKPLARSLNLLPATTSKISQLGQNEQAAIFHLIDDFRLSLSYAREFIDYLIDISRRDNIEIDVLLQNKVIKALKGNTRLPHRSKKEKLRELLRQWRFSRPIPADSFVPPAELPPEKKIIIARQKGKWLKRCPGTQKHICCNYLVINSITGCPFDCTYCFLHSYLNREGITIYNNQEELINELELFFAKSWGTHFRVGTGEFSDSLALDKKTGLSRKLIELFAAQKDHLLELKTKSAEVDHLLDCAHRSKTVIAWSVNPERIVASEELKTASLAERLKAAKRAVAAGYPVAFHFDPIIYYQGWEKDYQEVVRQIFQQVKPEDIAWISLGALRYQLKMKALIEKKWPHSPITLGELDVGEDNKFRYPARIRTELFGRMIESIRARAKDVYLYLCMESPEMWRQIKLKNQSTNRYAAYFKYFELDKN